MITSTQKNTRRARAKRSTPQENRLWSRLKNQALGYRFVRQHTHGPYVVDFCCVEKKLVIDIDGWKRRNNGGHDKSRSEYFSDYDYTVLRFWNNEVDDNLSRIMTEITKHLH